MCVTHYVYGGAYIYLLWQSIKKSNNQNRRIYVWCTSLLNDISREQFTYVNETQKRDLIFRAVMPCLKYYYRIVLMMCD